MVNWYYVFIAYTFFNYCCENRFRITIINLT